MTTLYKPVKIETVKQAEKLPIGTVAVFEPGSMLSVAAVKNAGPLPGWRLGDERVPVGEVPGYVALVPVEAEERIGAEMQWDMPTPHDTHVLPSSDIDNARWQIEHNPDHATGRIMRQYRTPWEEL